jgi:hypothetical protein
LKPQSWDERARGWSGAPVFDQRDDALLGLPGFRVLAVTEDGAELLVGIETIRRAAACPVYGVIARTKDWLRVVIRDLPGVQPARAARLAEAPLLVSGPGLSAANLDRTLGRAARSPRAVAARAGR